MPTNTPWGPSQTSVKIAPGIMQYTTASHGGIHLSPSKNKRVPDYLRHEDGWYEEDCDWAIPATIFPDPFAQHQATFSDIDIRKIARETLRAWHPEGYKKFYGVNSR